VNTVRHDTVRAVEWIDGGVRLIDQRRLPTQFTHLRVESCAAAAAAIRDMVVRGAPAIGITAAYGVVLAAAAAWRAVGEAWREAMAAQLAALRAARPTAVNLAWAVARMQRRINEPGRGDPVPALLAEARRIHAEDIAANHRMGRIGAGLLAEGARVLTHCNTGALATGGYGTALGVVRAGYGAGRIRAVYADETRPWLQGSRLTAWELAQEGIPVTVIADSAAAHLMRLGEIDWVVVGADRIAANGDVANKIGTYALAVSARHHGLGFMVVAPTSTVDMDTASGADIPIENRPEEEVLTAGGARTAPPDAHALNPAFDITPADLIDVIVTERGAVRRPGRHGIAAMMAEPSLAGA
jgi:methylthioribose-1-phosphate isomerase